ncbi:glutathione peroxidase [Arthrobacter sp. SD76]|uniref:glutathione peroxidase n=1 Tax=Arthrobacter sp. SD76 TaxID=3415007 RepID=UPI003C774B22
MSIYNIPISSMDGTTTTLMPYRDRVLLVVNVASQCGLTPQYKTLESLHKTFEDRGLSVLGFPSNQFEQEPGTDDEIFDFCSKNYGVSFPIFSKVSINGEDEHPLYAALKAAAAAGRTPEPISWNFEKFVVAPGARSHDSAPELHPMRPKSRR